MERELCDVLYSLKHAHYDDFIENMSIIIKLNKQGDLINSASEDDEMLIDTLMPYEGNYTLVQLFNKLADFMGNAGFGIEHLRHAFPFVCENEVVEYVFINKDLHVEIIRGYSDSYNRLCKLAYDSIVRIVNL